MVPDEDSGKLQGSAQVHTATGFSSLWPYTTLGIDQNSALCLFHPATVFWGTGLSLITDHFPGEGKTVQTNSSLGESAVMCQ